MRCPNRHPSWWVHHLSQNAPPMHCHAQWVLGHCLRARFCTGCQRRNPHTIPLQHCRSTGENSQTKAVCPALQLKLPEFPQCWAHFEFLCRSLAVWTSPRSKVSATCGNRSPSLCHPAHHSHNASIHSPRSHIVHCVLLRAEATPLQCFWVRSPRTSGKRNEGRCGNQTTPTYFCLQTTEPKGEGPPLDPEHQQETFSHSKLRCISCSCMHAAFVRTVSLVQTRRVHGNPQKTVDFRWVADGWTFFHCSYPLNLCCCCEGRGKIGHDDDLIDVLITVSIQFSHEYKTRK